MVNDHCEYCGHRSAHYPSCRGEIDKRACVERDRYRDAVRAIGELAWCDNCAPGYNLIVSALLDGEA